MEGGVPFTDLFPSLYQISLFHHQPIASFAFFSSYNGSLSLSWNFHYRCNLRDSELPELSSLLGLLEGVSLVEGEEDITR